MRLFTGGKKIHKYELIVNRKQDKADDPQHRTKSMLLLSLCCLYFVLEVLYAAYSPNKIVPLPEMAALAYSEDYPHVTTIVPPVAQHKRSDLSALTSRMPNAPISETYGYVDTSVPPFKRSSIPNALGPGTENGSFSEDYSYVTTIVPPVIGNTTTSFGSRALPLKAENTSISVTYGYVNMTVPPVKPSAVPNALVPTTKNGSFSEAYELSPPTNVSTFVQPKTENSTSTSGPSTVVFPTANASFSETYGKVTASVPQVMRNSTSSSTPKALVPITKNTRYTSFENSTLPNVHENLIMHGSPVIADLTAKPPKAPSQYYVSTEQCRMPKIDPFAPEARKIFKPSKYYSCAKDEPLVSVLFNATSRHHVLHMNLQPGERHANLSGNVSCCYRQIVRSGTGKNADSSFKLLPCSNFLQDFEVPNHIEFMIVDCTMKSTKKVFQQDAFSFIQDKQNLKATKDATPKPNGGRRKPNVLLIGIDSMSRTNFRRNMKETYKYIETHNNWFEMQGYNKVGDNTFPNLMPLLTGYNDSESFHVCKPTTVGGLDKCGFIWKSFKEAGYKTAYAEDGGWISTFNYLKKGFQQPPTDYYLRPLTLAIEKNMKTDRTAGLIDCIGRRHYAEYIYDYALEFVEHFPDDPLFGLFWTNSFSHNSYDTSSAMDGKMLKYLRTLEAKGVFENSIVMFFSDHGCRWGSLLKLSSGFFEERWPMFFISLPKWFKQQHPDFVQALEVNKHRLLSPFDVHETLNHIAQLYEPQANITSTNGCKTCHSIFKEASVNRTCPQAGIPEHWCTCIPYEVVSTKGAIVKNVTQLVIKEMNLYLEHKNLTDLCSTLKLKSIENAHLKMEEHLHEHQHLIDKAKENPTYRIEFETNPHDASFQATATFYPGTNSIKVNVENISRTNSYAKDSNCTDDKQAKKYCICKKR